jgi:hypothetical protein
MIIDQRAHLRLLTIVEDLMTVPQDVLKLTRASQRIP